jgi:hypothetical protein
VAPPATASASAAVGLRLLVLKLYVRAHSTPLASKGIAKSLLEILNTKYESEFGSREDK